MKIGFFGTPEIAAFCLDKLRERFEIAFVVTGPDKPRGRHRRIQSNPVKRIALDHSMKFFHPESLRDPEFIDALKSAGADIFVIVAYGRLIPAEVFEIPPLKTINLHPSLLPKYRGAAPVEWALINGESRTGVTVQLINERLDAGDVLLQRTIPLSEEITAGELYDIIMPAGAALLIEAIENLDAGRAVPSPQNEDDAGYCGKINRETARIDWAKPSRAIHNLVRGLNPRPCAWSILRSMECKILRTALCDDEHAEGLAPGGLFAKGKRLYARTGDGLLEIIRIQPETRKDMDGLSFINGYRPARGERFEF